MKTSGIQETYVKIYLFPVLQILGRTGGDFKVKAAEAGNDGKEAVAEVSNTARKKTTNGKTGGRRLQCVRVRKPSFSLFFCNYTQGELGPQISDV